MDWSKYDRLSFEYPSDGVLVIRINRPERKNAMDQQLHTQFAQVWHDVAADPKTRAVVVTGQGEAFSAGGDFEMVEDTIGNYATVKRLFQEAADIVYNITNCPKPVISAINGVAVGAGLAVALMADISIMSEDARLTDGHVKIGVAAGDHAAIIWPLLCGLAKARYYLLTCEFIDGREAERIGLVSKSVPAEELLPNALKIAERLARGSADAISATKRTLNHWVRDAGPIFESSLAMEMLGFFSPDAREGLDAMREKRYPVFPSSRQTVGVDV
ncbi:enoyl-CoA hydratase/isomerase family protein [Rhodococcus jostii]|uniref:Enoyl-CoA hydratase n=1 Tax=Rhodococcus jostii TaxID=132919 RepID=A0A1H4IMI1_RHOJO|nr:enoyl-CoA hydratase/isomerase family protein [Rhodococcus jostii]SEB35279.1 enoyl-CoA hydratase [Rhodococcus jostii]